MIKSQNSGNSDDGDLDIDKIISKLLEARDKKPGRQIYLTEQDIKCLCLKSREIFLSQSMLIELDAPIKICGTYSKTHPALLACINKSCLYYYIPGYSE